MAIGGHRVEKVLIEAQVPIAREFYAAILNDPVSKGPLLLFSTLGGMDVEEAAAQDPQALRRHPIAIADGLKRADAAAAAAAAGPETAPALSTARRALSGAYRRLHADPIAITKSE